MANISKRIRVGILLLVVVSVFAVSVLFFQDTYVNSDYDISGNLMGEEGYGYSRSFVEEGRFKHVTVFKAPSGDYEVRLVKNNVMTKNIGSPILQSSDIYTIEFESNKNYSEYTKVIVLRNGKIILRSQME